VRSVNAFEYCKPRIHGARPGDRLGALRASVDEQFQRFSDASPSLVNGASLSVGSEPSTGDHSHLCFDTVENRDDAQRAQHSARFSLFAKHEPILAD
jgi:hypothetical protein